MSDATYVTPITRPSKTGVRIDVITIDRNGPRAHVVITEVDADGNAIESYGIDVNANSPDTATAVRDFITALLTPVAGEPTNAVLKLNRRCIKYLASLNALPGATA